MDQSEDGQVGHSTGQQMTRYQFLLSQFPGPITLYPNRLIYIVLSTLSVAFLAMGVFLLVKQPGSVVAWSCVTISGVCTLFFAAYLVPGSTSLTLDSEGVQVRIFKVARRVPWQSLGQDICAVSVGAWGNDMRIVRLNNGQWLPGMYGSLSGDDLAELITQWRDRALDGLLRSAQHRELRDDAR